MDAHIETADGRGAAVLVGATEQLEDLCPRRLLVGRGPEGVILLVDGAWRQRLADLALPQNGRVLHELMQLSDVPEEYQRHVVGDLGIEVEHTLANEPSH